MFKGESSQGIEFYKLLYSSEEFTSELGKITLASGKLEVQLILFLKKNKIEYNYEKATLGRLIKISKENNLLSENEIISFKMILKQRNYLTHNIYSLFTNMIDESIFERDNLVDTDVLLYIERASQLVENINHFSDIVEKKIKDLF